MTTEDRCNIVVLVWTPINCHDLAPHHVTGCGSWRKTRHPDTSDIFIGITSVNLKLFSFSL